jgi:hypothetical protein
MKQKLCLLMLLALIVMVAIPACAFTITMANPGGIAERDIIVYFPNGTMQGFYNSTSVIDLDVNSSYIFAMKPLSVNPLEDPADWLKTIVFPFVQTNVLALLVIIILAAIWWKGGK